MYLYSSATLQSRREPAMWQLESIQLSAHELFTSRMSGVELAMVVIPGGWKSLVLEHLQPCLGCDPTR